jgi:hypothetical protein
MKTVPWHTRAMPKRISLPRVADPNVLAKSIVDSVLEGFEDEPPEKDAAAVALGRKGGKKGGKARASKLTDERRREIAQKAAKARWSKK